MAFPTSNSKNDLSIFYCHSKPKAYFHSFIAAADIVVIAVGKGIFYFLLFFFFFFLCLLAS